ncbi:alpha/beta fold hydrolase [Chloroflexota bacterium]
MTSENETFDGTWPFKPHFSTAPGFRMHYVDEGEGEPIVMLHGEPTWGYIYRNFIPPLSKTHRVIVPDHMGFGKSETPQNREYTLKTHVENLTTLIEELDLQDITFVLQDWGGPIGGCYTHLHPERVKRLCLVNGAVPNATTYTRQPNQPMIRAQSAPWFQWIGDGLEAGRYHEVLGNLGSTILSVMKLLGFQNSAAVTNTWIRAYSAHFTSPEECKGAIEFPLDAYYGRALPFYYECALAGKEETRKRPAMLVRGMKDYAITRENMVGSFRDLWPKGPIIELENAGHFSQEDLPEIIVPLIQQFIQMTE